MQRGEPPFVAAAPRHGVRRRASAQSAARGARWSTDRRTLAIVLGVLAVLGLLGATLSFTVDLLVAPGRLFTADLEEFLHLLASAVGLAGAFQLWRGGRRGRPVILFGLSLNVVATFAFSPGTLGQSETVIPLLTWLVLGLLTIVSRWTGTPSPAGSGPAMGPVVPRWPD